MLDIQIPKYRGSKNCRHVHVRIGTNFIECVFYLFIPLINFVSICKTYSASSLNWSNFFLSTRILRYGDPMPINPSPPKPSNQLLSSENRPAIYLRNGNGTLQKQQGYFDWSRSTTCLALIPIGFQYTFQK